MNIVKKSWVLSVVAIFGGLNIQCSESKMKGEVQSAHVEAPVKAEPTADAIPVSPAPVAAPVAAPVSTPVAAPTKQEEINSCTACVARAKVLSETIGFTASLDKTKNIGYYKIDRKFGLCDIHFMADLDDKIEDHDGMTSSILSNQVVLYCPCDCDWATTAR